MGGGYVLRPMPGEKHTFLPNLCHRQETYLIDRPRDKSIRDTATVCVPGRKQDINAGGQLAVSTANRRLGAEWAGGHCVSHVVLRLG